VVEYLIHRRAVGIDYAVQRWRAERARKSGYITEVIPYTSYGSTSWLRILARVLLAKNSQRQADLPTGVRGWRNFVGVPVENARVNVDTEAGSHEVQADHSGIIDVVIDVELEP